MKDNLTKLFKKIVNADNFVHAKSIVIDFLSNTDLNDIEIRPQPGHMVVILLGGKQSKIPSADYCLIASMLAIPKRIQAIKHLRSITGGGLKDAKDAVLDYQNWPVTPLDKML